MEIRDIRTEINDLVDDVQKRGILSQKAKQAGLIKDGRIDVKDLIDHIFDRIDQSEVAGVWK